MEQFDQLLTCAICLDRYRNPKLLPCQHSFCMEPCMEGLINYVTRQVKCPECRAEHRIPYQGIQQYPTNVTLQRFLELHIEITGELPDPTSGQVMERCGVCSEKSYCSACSHCDKRVCSDCKEAHLDILRREIARVNGQVRRTLPRLQDALGVIDKNSIQLQQNCSNIIEEVDGIYARLSKALKDRTDSIKSEVEVFLAKELRSLTGLRANLEHEISNFDSNSEFAEKHINSENCSVTWDDNELMDAKDIFLRTMEFIRNFESEPGEYHRRVRFFVPQDINQLSNTMSNLGELNINPSQATSSSAMYPLSQGAPSAPSLGPGLMRSKSDHRVAAQFRQAEERYQQSYGSDNNDDSFSTSRQRYFGDRHNTSRPAVESSRYGESTTSSSRRGDYEYDDNTSTADTGRRSRFRSRFMRHHDSGDSDNEVSNRSVRFQSTDCSSDAQGAVTKKVERQRVLDTEDAARGPLSGITRLADSPRVLKRIQEVELKGRRRKPTPPTTLSLNVTSTTAGQLPSPSQPRPPTGSGRVTGRQVSEEDEIAKIKKQNKSQEAATAASTGSGAASAEVTSASSRKSDSSVPSTPTSAGERPRFSSSNSNDSKPTASRQTSTSSEPTTRNRTENDSSSSTATPTGDEDGRVRKRSTYQSGNGATGPESGGSGSRPVSFTSNTSSPGDESSERAGRKVGRVSVDRFNKSASSESSTSAESSTHSSPVRNTGAAFSTGEIKSRFIGRKSSTGSNGESGSSTAAGSSAATMATSTTRSRFGNLSTSGSGTPSTTTSSGRYGSTSTSVSSPATTTTTSSSSSNGTNGTAVAPHRFQSRFLGRAGTPTAEASKGSENSQSSSDDDSSDSSESDSADQRPPRKSAAATASTVTAATGKDRETLARTDIGPLLARSAQARDTSTSYPSSSSTTNRQQQQEPSSSSSYSTRVRTNPSSATGSNTATARSYGTSRYGTDATGAGSSSSSIARSRTGSSLAEDLENKYPLTSKYLNRSRASMASDPTETTSYAGSSTGARKFSSRFLNKSESFAALNLAEKKDASDDDDDDDDENYLQPSQVTADDRRAQKDQRSSLSSSTRRLVGNKSPSPTLPLSQKSQLAVSGEDRYPSGRSRYAALKDRRSRLARSRSSHEVVAHQQQGLPVPQHCGSGVEVEDTRTSTHAQEPTSPSTEGSSLSTWARYLKNKYGPRNKEGEDGKNQDSAIDSAKSRRFSRSRSIGSSNLSNNNNERWGAVDNNKESNLITSQHHSYTQKRKVLIKFGTRGSEPGAFTWPRGVAIGPDNSIVVADSSNHRVQVFQSDGTFLKEFGYYGNSEGEFDCLAGVSVNRIGQFIIADRYNHRIQVFDPSGRFLRAFGSQGTTDGKFSYPWGVTTDALGFIYVCDKENHRVQVFQSDGTFVGKFGSLGSRPGQLEHPHYIAVSSTNRVIVSDSNNHRIQVFDVNGKLITSFGSEGAEEGQFKFPRGVAVDDQGFIIVADSGNNRIVVADPDGGFVTSFGCWGSGDGEFKGLEGIAVLPNGNIVVCDRENHRLQIF